MILEARGLAIGYGRRLVGRGLDLAVAPGEVLALLGPNGGGKTTLLKTLLGLLRPLSGEVRLDGRPAGDWAPRERARRVAYVPQVHAGTFPFTVAEMVLMGRVAHGGLFAPPSSNDRAAAERAMGRLGIGHLAQRPYTLISGGERQLALIARALAQEPKAVLLDEPTASLDFGNQGTVMREIGRLAGGGLGVVFSTHDPNHALRHADKAVLIRDGAILASGKASEVLGVERLGRLYDTVVEQVGSGDALAYRPGG